MTEPVPSASTVSNVQRTRDAVLAASKVKTPADAAVALPEAVSSASDMPTSDMAQQVQVGPEASGPRISRLDPVTHQPIQTPPPVENHALQPTYAPPPPPVTQPVAQTSTNPPPVTVPPGATTADDPTVPTIRNAFTYSGDTSIKAPNQDPRTRDDYPLTPAELANIGKAMDFWPAFRAGIPQGLGPYTSVWRFAGLYAMAAEIPKKAGYLPLNDPFVQSLSGSAQHAVVDSHSPEETVFILKHLQTWSQEAADLEKSGAAGSLGYLTGMALDPMNLLGMSELKIHPGELMSGSAIVDQLAAAERGVHSAVLGGTSRVLGFAAGAATSWWTEEVMKNGLSLATGLLIGTHFGPLAGTGASFLAHKWLGPRIGRLAELGGEAAKAGAELTSNAAFDRAFAHNFRKAAIGIQRTVPLWMGLEGVLQGTASALDPTRPNGTFLSAMLTAGITSTVVGGFRGWTAHEIGALENHLPGVAGETAAVDPLANSDPPFEQQYQAILGNESGGIAGEEAKAAATSGAKAIGKGQVLEGTAKEVAEDLGEHDVANMTSEQRTAWLHETPLETLTKASAGMSDEELQKQLLTHPGQDAHLVEAMPRETVLAELSKFFTSNSERYGKAYYAKQLKKYGDIRLAAAAYNAGPAAVDELLINHGDPRTGAISWSDWLDALPGGYKVTAQYVRDVMKRLDRPIEGKAGAKVGGEPGDTTRTTVEEPVAPKVRATHSISDVTFTDEHGTPTNQEQATHVRTPGKSFAIGDISLVDEKGNHIAGAPLTEGTPAAYHTGTTLLDKDGKVVTDPAKAAQVIVGSESHPMEHVQIKDDQVNILNDPPPPLGGPISRLGDWFWRNKAFLARETIERILEGEEQTAGAPTKKDKTLGTTLGGSTTFEAYNKIHPDQHRSAGAAGTAPGFLSYDRAQRLYGMAMQKIFGLDPSLIPMSPILRLSNSPSLIVRELLERLTQLGHGLNKHLVGDRSVVPVWTRYKLWQGQVNTALAKTDQLYKDYVRRVGGADMNAAQRLKTSVTGSPGIMSRGQFYEAVGKAKRYLDTPDMARFPTEAGAAAREFDKIYKDVADRGDAAGAWKQPLIDQLEKLAPMFHDYLQRGRIGDARQIAKQMDDLRRGIAKQEAKEGAGGTYRPDYGNRIWRQDQVASRRAELVQIMEAHGMTERAANGAIDSILKMQPYDPSHPDSIGRASALHQRTLDFIPDRAIEDFLVNDISVMSSAYVRQTGVDVLLAEEFGGDINLSRHMGEIVNDYKKIWDDSAHPTTGEVDLSRRPAIQKQMLRDLQDVRDLRDMIRGTFGLASDPQAHMSRAIRFAKNFNIATQLTGFVSALSDMVGPVMKEGIAANLSASLDLFHQGIGMLKFAKSEALLYGHAADTVTALRSSMLHHISDTFANTSRVEGVMQHVASGRMAIDLMAQYQDWLKSYASIPIGTNMLRSVERLASGRASDAEINRLAGSYIDRNMAQKIMRQYQQHGIEMGSQRFANTAMWDADPIARDAFRGAMNREINNTVMGDVTPGERPTWTTTEFGSLLAQFRTYGFTATHRLLIPGLQQPSRQFVTGMVALVGMGMVTDMLLSKSRGEDWNKKSLKEKIVNAIDRSGALGPLMDINNGVEALTFGGVGLRPSMGIHTNSGPVAAASAVGGPTISSVSNLGQAVFGGKNPHQTAQARLRTIPLMNTAQFRMLFNHLKDPQAGQPQPYSPAPEGRPQ